MFSFQVHFQQFINSINALMVPVMAFPSQTGRDFAHAVRGVCLGVGLYGGNNFRVVASGNTIIHRNGQKNQGAGLANG